MDLRMWKIGEPSFDILRAAGLCIALGMCTEDAVELLDEGVQWNIRCRRPICHLLLPELLYTLITLPTTDHIETFAESGSSPEIALANLDGLLALAYTAPGVRVLSVHDIITRSRHRAEIITDSLAKGIRFVDRLVTHTEKLVQHGENWLLQALHDYQINSDVFPQLAPKCSGDISIPMTLAASLGYSSRRSLSDGFLAERVNLTLRGERFGIVLLYLGAARFLRAQHVAGGLVNLYVPLPRTLTFTPDTTLPIFRASDMNSQQALLAHWLTFPDSVPAITADWRGIAYQRLQTQGQQQSISVDRGVLTYDWLRDVQQRAGDEIGTKWRSALIQDHAGFSRDIDQLVDLLYYRNGTSWLRHLRDLSLAAHRQV